MVKTCIRCQTPKPSGEFYRHDRMRGGLLTVCKECVRARVKAYYRRTHEARLDYEHVRTRRPRDRKRRLESQRKYRARHHEKVIARSKLGYAIRKGHIKRGPCAVCGSKKTEGHHWDYSKPYDVIWLCFTHHRAFEGRLIEGAA